MLLYCHFLLSGESQIGDATTLDFRDEAAVLIIVSDDGNEGGNLWAADNFSVVVECFESVGGRAGTWMGPCTCGCTVDYLIPASADPCRPWSPE